MRTKKRKELDPYKNCPLLFLDYQCFKCKKVGYFSVAMKCACKSSSQFKSKKVICQGIAFPSIREAYRFSQLSYCQVRLRLISDLELQPKFVLTVNGVDVCKYTADFRFRDDKGEMVEEVKGRYTAVFILRFKLFKALFPNVRIRIIK